MSFEATASLPPLPVDARVGDFEVIAVLASDAGGFTYLTTDLAQCRLAAVREFAPAQLATRGAQGALAPQDASAQAAYTAALQRFVAHAQALAALDHPALARVYRVWQAQGTAYAAMPFAYPRTVQTLLDDLGRPPDEAWLRQLLAPLTHALAQMHQAGMCGCGLSATALLVQPGGPAPRFTGLWPAVAPDEAPDEAAHEVADEAADDVQARMAADIRALGVLAAQVMRGPPLPAGGTPVSLATAGRYGPSWLAAVEQALSPHPPSGMAAWRAALGFGESDGAGLPRPAAPAADSGAPVPPPRDNLPQHATPFLGREQETQAVLAHLARARLVTLTGMGGVGKTRLALQVGERSLDAFTDGVWFLDLASLRDAQQVVQLAAQVLGVREAPGQALVQAVLAHLKGKYLLLVVDNCEHLVSAAAAFINQAVRGVPGLRVLASSREALRVPGEVACPVLPLPLPEAEAALQALQASSAVRLFVARAQDYRHSFHLGEDNRRDVAELVRRLEGIPLALELAAARVRTLGVADINRRLHDRFQLLTRGPRVAHERQHTLRATLDWSHELLQDDEKTLFRRLGVFVGGLDLDAAEAVCGSAPLAPADVMDLLRSLVDKSLLMLDERDGGTRYQLLETMREYALEKLRDAGEAPALAAAHGLHYFALAKQVRDGLQGKDQGEWARRGEADIDNLRAASALALAGGIDPLVSVKMAVALQGFWILRGYLAEGRALVRQALALPEVQANPVPHAHALYVDAALALVQGDLAAAHGQLTTCLALRRELGNPADIAATLSTLAHAHIHEAALARAWAGEALELLRALGTRHNEAIVLQDLGRIEQFAGNLAGARDYIMQSLALALAREVRHPETEAECERLLCELDVELGDLGAAQLHAQASRRVCIAAGDRRGEACARLWLGRLATVQARQPEAAEHLAAALRFFRDHGMRAEWLDALAAIAELGAQGHDTHAALRLLQAVQALGTAWGLVLNPRQVAHQAALLRAWQSSGTEGAAGEPLDLADATALAMRLVTS